MLAGDFYEILSFTSPETGTGTGESAMTVALNASHAVFGGHFPGNPVVPGVCQVQMVMELVEKTLGRKLRLTESDNIKFLATINPVDSPVLEVKVTLKPADDSRIPVTASISRGETVFLKFKGKFEAEP